MFPIKEPGWPPTLPLLLFIPRLTRRKVSRGGWKGLAKRRAFSLSLSLVEKRKKQAPSARPLRRYRDDLSNFFHPPFYPGIPFTLPYFHVDSWCWLSVYADRNRRSRRKFEGLLFKKSLLVFRLEEIICSNLPPCFS